MARVAITTFATRTALSVALSMAFAGCSQKSPCLRRGIDVEIASDHTHSASVPAGQVRRGIKGSYPVRGVGHGHVFVLNDDEVEQLERGEPVRTRTSSANAHAHALTVRCKE